MARHDAGLFGHLTLSTTAPRQWCPAAIGRKLLRLVIHEFPPEAESIGR